MKKCLRILLLGSMISLALACVYDYEAEWEGGASYVVVEGDIQAGGITTVSFSRDGHYSRFTASVEGEDGTVVEAPAAAAGTISLDTRQLNPDIRYRLRIHELENGLHYASSWQDVQPAPVIDSLGYRIEGERMELCATFHSDGPTPYYCLSYDEEWEYLSYAVSYYRYYPPGAGIPDGGRELFPDPDSGLGDRYGRIFRFEEPSPNHVCWQYSATGQSSVVTTGAVASNKMVDYAFKTLGREDVRLSVKYRVMVSLRMISEASYTYWESIEQTSGQTGDLFSPIPSLQRGNIVCEEEPDALVLGYIGASAWARDELWIDRNEVLFYREPASVTAMLEREAIGLTEPHGVPESQMHYWYDSGYRPWRRISPESGGSGPETYYVWIPERCLDCTTQGGSVTKPAGWPD